MDNDKKLVYDAKTGKYIERDAVPTAIGILENLVSFLSGKTSLTTSAINGLRQRINRAIRMLKQR
jgi:hypothetical protein